MEPITAHHAQYKGSFSRWLKDKYTIRRNAPHETTSCWRTLDSDGARVCMGASEAWQACLSVPVMLIVHVTVGEITWDFPSSVAPIKISALGEDDNTASSNQSAVTYDMVGRVFQRRSDGHFTARFTNPANSAVYAYNDLAHSGYAQRIKKATLKTHLAGTDEKICIPSGTSTAFVVYHLRGGTAAQKRIFEHQCSVIEDIHKVHVTYQRFGDLPTVSLNIPQTRELADEERYWMTNPYSTVYRDYEHVPPQSPPAAEATPKGPALGAPSQPPPAVKGKKTKLTLKLRAESPKPSLPWDFSKDSDEITESRPPDTQVTKSSEGRSDSPFPFLCRCGADGDGHSLCNDEEAIQCYDCERWSHLACQRNGWASKLTPRQKFVCDLCNPLTLLPP